jgi:hypothetical protein
LKHHDFANWRGEQEKYGNHRKPSDIREYPLRRSYWAKQEYAGKVYRQQVSK